jgi:hypothetical protein
MNKDLDFEGKHKEDLERLHNLRLLDDDFMTKVFEDTKCAEFLLQIILKRDDLKVTKSTSQYGIKNLQGRSVRLDILAVDQKNHVYNIEIQRSDHGAGVKRARYNSSLIDANVTEPGEQYEALNESYVIFITENDVLGKSLPIYHIERTVTETGEPFGDEEHIVYVNSQIRNKTSLGMLMHDFACTAASEGWGYGIVATGMLASGEPTNEAWRYWPVQDEWEALNPVPGPARHRAAGMPGFNGVVVAGGADSAFAPLADAWSFATWFETGEWYPAPALPEARAWLHGASNDLVLLLGGQSEPGVLHANCWKQGNTGWEALPDFGGGPRKGLVVLGQQESPWNYNCYAGLGIDSANVRKKDWWKLDVALAIDEHAASFIGIFPNPAKNWVTLKFPAGFTGAKVHVSDALGRSVFDGAVQNNALDVSSFAPGQYVVRGISGTSLVRGTFIKLP